MRPAPDAQGWALRIPGCEIEAAFTENRDIVTNYYFALSLNPLNKYPGMEIAPVLGAVCFEQGFADEDPPDKIVDSPNQ
jgi:hypothetical protein